MRVISGSMKGRLLSFPKDIRPTQNKIRKAVFDIVGQDMSGIDFLELFAGSGAVSLEALSRNAARVSMVERDSASIETIESNLNTLNIDGYGESGAQVRIFPTDVFISIKKFSEKQEKFDVIFADPPYEVGLGKKTLKTIVAYDILQPNTVVIIQHHKNEILPEDEGRIRLIRRRQYGSSVLSIYQQPVE